QQPFALVVEHVLLLAIEIFNGKAIYRELRIAVHPPLHGFERDRQQFRIKPGRGLRRLGEQYLDLLTLGVRLVVALILVVAERGEVPDLVLELADGVAECESTEERVRAPRERPVQLREFANLAIELRIRVLPGG